MDVDNILVKPCTVNFNCDIKLEDNLKYSEDGMFFIIKLSS